MGYAAIVQWIRLPLPSCRPGFESQAHHLRFHRFIELCNVEKTKINKKEAGIGPFFLKKVNLPVGDPPISGHRIEVQVAIQIVFGPFDLNRRILLHNVVLKTIPNVFNKF